MYDAKNEELFTIRQDVADPLAQHAGIETGLVGNEYEMRMDGGKTEVAIRWRDRLTVADVYEMDDHIMLHMYCPNCTQCLSIQSQKKRIRFNRSERRIDMGSEREPLRCSYQDCDWRAYIEDNVAKEV